MKTPITVLAILTLYLQGCAGTPPADRSAPATQPEQTGVLRGMYRYLADAALFTDCETGRTLPVAMEGDSRALERAYLQARHQPGEALLVTLEGRIVPRMPMEGPGPVDMLLPGRFIGIRDGADCAGSAPAAALLGTRWRLTYLGDVPAVHYPDQREAQIVLHDDGRVTGSDGCNLVSGGFRSEGDGLTFTPLASTMMACPQGVEQEQAFSRALGATARYRTPGGYLELLDAAGSLLARFEAVAPQ